MSELESEMNGAAEEHKPAFESSLPQGRQRFLAHVIEHSLSVGRRTHDDFIRHFPPALIMEGLRDQPQLRANILVITTGVKTKIARKKNYESAGNDLQIALEEGEADAETIVTLFEPDDRVRFLDPKKLWAYVIEGDFWRAKSGIDFDIAKAHIAFMLDRALKDELVSHLDIVEGMTVSKLAEHLPRIELEKIITAALMQSQKEKPFREEDLLRETPSTTLVEHVPLPHVWETVVEPKIARAHDFLHNLPSPGAIARKSEAPPATGAAESPSGVEGAEAPGDDEIDVAVSALDALAEGKENGAGLAASGRPKADAPQGGKLPPLPPRRPK